MFHGGQDQFITCFSMSSPTHRLGVTIIFWMNRGAGLSLLIQVWSILVQ
jgi:hypothetical protein